MDTERGEILRVTKAGPEETGTQGSMAPGLRVLGKVGPAFQVKQTLVACHNLPFYPAHHMCFPQNPKTGSR